MQVWSNQVCVNTMKRRKDIRDDFREAAVDAHQSLEGLHGHFKQFKLHHSIVGKIIYNEKGFKASFRLARNACPRKFTPRSDQKAKRIK